MLKCIQRVEIYVNQKYIDSGQKDILFILILRQRQEIVMNIKNLNNQTIITLRRSIKTLSLEIQSSSY